MSNNAPASNLPLDATPERTNVSTAKTELDPLFFQQVPHLLVNDVAQKRLTPLDVVVYIVLKKHLGQNPVTWVGNTTISKLCGKSTPTVRRSIKRLQRAGHIERFDCDQGHTARTRFCTTVINGRAVSSAPTLSVNEARLDAGEIQAMQESEMPQIANEDVL